MLLGLIFGWACQPPHPTPAAPSELVIAHTNDLHGHFRANPAPWLEGRPEIGGFGAIGAHLEALRRHHGTDHVLYLDGGDVLTGTPLMEFEVHGAHGGAMLDFLDAVGCTAWVLGNHEFDRGWENVAALVAGSRVPVVSANLDHPDRPGQPAMPALQDHLIVEAAGLKIGVFGLTTGGLGHLASRATLSHIDLEQPIESARTQVELLEEQVDLVVALTHIGVEADQALARAVPGIDLIVGGHSHTALVEPIRQGETWIVQAGSYGRQLGLTRLSVADGRITTFHAELIDLLPETLPGPVPQEVADLQQHWQSTIDARFAETIGELAADLSRSDGAETSMGRFASDVVRIAADSELGLYNAGGLRNDLMAGQVTVGDLYQVFPFSNEVVSFTITGAQLQTLLLRTVKQPARRGGGMKLQFSGLALQWRAGAEGPEIVSLTVGGAPVDPQQPLRLATNSYIAEQWEHHLGFEPVDLQRHELTVREAAQQRFAQEPFEIPRDPRIARID